MVLKVKNKLRILSKILGDTYVFLYTINSKCTTVSHGFVCHRKTKFN